MERGTTLMFNPPVGTLPAAGSALVVLVMLVLILPEAAEAEGPYEAGTTGYDISFPQCGRTLHMEPPFVIIGVNGGRPFTSNQCFAAQYEWAKSRSRQVSLYVNTANPGPGDRRWNAPGPRACNAPLASDDVDCAYNYGWNAAQEAVALAERETAGESRGKYWWLDVETMNRWAGSPAANAAVLVAFVDYLAMQGVGGIGIYSTGLQWKLITGGHQFPGIPNWVAGASHAAGAPRLCSAGFSGGPVWLVQYVADNLDHNFVCEAAAVVQPVANGAEEKSEDKSEDAPGTAVTGPNFFDQIRDALFRAEPRLRGR